MRIIDAEVLLKHLETFLTDHKTVIAKTTIKAIMAIIEMMPAIEAKPVVHAHWETDFDFDPEEESEIDFYICSNCKGSLFGNKEEFKYCPYCGAQMDEPISQGHENGVKIPVISMEDVPKIMEEMEK